MTVQIEPGTFLSGANSAFLEDVYAQFLRDPAQVEPGWRRFFGELGDDPAQALAGARGASWGRPIVLELEDDIGKRPKADGKAASAEGRACRGPRYDPRADDDPRLPRPRAPECRP